jgi:hypothetical protein
VASLPVAALHAAKDHLPHKLFLRWLQAARVEFQVISLLILAYPQNKKRKSSRARAPPELFNFHHYCR